MKGNRKIKNEQIICKILSFIVAMKAAYNKSETISHQQRLFATFLPGFSLRKSGLSYSALTLQEDE